MKQTLLFLLATSGLFSAQTTITKAFNDPIVGETVNNVMISGTVDNSATGANTTFNNAALTQGTASPTIYSAPAAGELTTFPGSTIKMVGSGNTILYKQTASKLEITGLITPDATLNLSANNGTFISYPAAFGYNETDQAQGTFTSPTASGLCKGTINITADASGTLILGASTFSNVVRIKSVQNFNLHLPNDTNFLVPIGSVTNTAYTYYDSTHKFPLLTTTQAVINVPIAGINQTTSGAQALSQLFLSALDNNIKKQSLKVFPNPAQDFIEFKGDTANLSTVNIYSLDGKLIKTSDLKAGKVQVSELPAAAYFIEVSGKDSKKEATKFIKK
ncbi:Por secretion system C-terminal sorting domain-containing protein [Chryseobacterium soldanellicola]|uniref:Por secretion system C-terminal sorting domain-containing protein n=1 Tax=Chryseobacterium soldanellicola TaxID=311333 RepID=A0A1H1DV34_9FLAO|nr:T9SS type A sorting domain-containing protein [Chryseobacterium soldanellicola]SDQ80412.1 Por secretion system C-terminal sorting domain-containing protein [Chryseobacterium soldanellicola]